MGLDEKAPPMNKPQEYYWVPEDCIFESAPDCLGEYPYSGPACLVASHVFYENLKSAYAALKGENELLKDNLRLLDEYIKGKENRK